MSYEDDTIRRGAKTWLVGESNPYGSDPQYALYPYPPGCSGARLCSFLGLTEDEYLERFERRNLLAQEKWSAPAARKAAAVLLEEVADSDRLVLLGAKVAQAFSFDFQPLAIHSGRFVGARTGARRPCRVLLAPHPSGMNRAWHDPELPARLRAALAELEAGAVTREDDDGADYGEDP